MDLYTLHVYIAKNARKSMSLDNAIYALSNFNAIMGGINGFNRDKQNGVPIADAISNFGFNTAGGLFRNSASKAIAQETGSYLGYAVNNSAGYGTAEANAQGTTATINTAMITSPYGIFGAYNNPYMMSSIYGYGPMGGYWNGGGFFGGGCGPMMGGFWGGGCGCNHGSPFIMTGPTMFAPRGFWC